MSEGRLPISHGLQAAAVDMHVLFVINGMYLGGTIFDSLLSWQPDSKRYKSSNNLYLARNHQALPAGSGNTNISTIIKDKGSSKYLSHIIVYDKKSPQNNERRIFALHKTPTPLASDRSAGCNFVAQVWLPRTDQLSKTKSNISVLKQINKTVC